MATPNPSATSQEADHAMRRGLLPEVLFGPDLAFALGLQDAGTAIRAVRRLGIPCARIGRRVAVRRTALLEWVASRESPPSDQVLRLLGADRGRP
jgi:hypothetical protein